MAILSIPIAKGMGNLDVDTDKLGEKAFAMALIAGLKVLLNSKQSKLATPKAIKELIEAGTEKSLKEAEEHKAKAMAKAEENLSKCYDDSFKMATRGGASDTKVPRELMTEAMRIARNVVRDAIRDQGGKISHYKASDITATAKEVLDGEQGPGIFAEAQANLDARKTTPTKISLGSLKADPTLVRKAEEKKLKAKQERENAPQLSAAQAGKVRARAKAEQTVH